MNIIKRSMAKHFDSSDDYDGVVGRFRGHSEHADEQLEEYLIGIYKQ